MGVCFGGISIENLLRVVVSHPVLVFCGRASGTAVCQLGLGLPHTPSAVRVRVRVRFRSTPADHVVVVTKASSQIPLTLSPSTPNLLSDLLVKCLSSDFLS